MSDSTNIMDLPTDPAGSNAKLPTQQPQQPPGPGMTLDQLTINQIVSGIQQASIAGATQLPSRDISNSTESITHDAYVQPNFVPPPVASQQQQQYIDEDDSAEDILNEYKNQKEYSNNLDEFYADIQTPLLLGALFFLFQLPFFRKYLFEVFPVLFSLDGNLNIKGYLFMSAMFGITYYAFNKIQLL